MKAKSYSNVRWLENWALIFSLPYLMAKSTRQSLFCKILSSIIGPNFFPFPPFLLIFGQVTLFSSILRPFSILFQNFIIQFYPFPFRRFCTPFISNQIQSYIYRFPIPFSLSSYLRIPPKSLSSLWRHFQKLMMFNRMLNIWRQMISVP